jgi:Beta-propeller repeat
LAPHLVLLHEGEQIGMAGWHIKGINMSALSMLVLMLACSQLVLTPARASTPIDAVGARIVAGYGRLPLTFEQNRGQTDSKVKFLARGAGYAVFLTPAEAVLKLRPSQGAERDSGVLRVRLVRANSNAALAGEALVPGHSNYFLGNDQSTWRTQVEQFAQVRYRNVYPGVDLIYYGNQQQLEYDFIVAPGADPDAIRMAYRGAQRLFIDAQGDLRIKTASGELIQRKPVVYQTINGQKKWVESRFILDRHGLDREVSFRLAAYDTRLPLVIDPVLVYSSFLGGSGEDAILAIAVDPSGSVTMVGSTQSIDFPTRAAVVATNSNQTDAFVTKFNPAGNALIYSTYLGTLASCPPAPCLITQATAVAVDGTGNAYVTGRTQAPDFPIHDAFQPLFGGGGFDIFVTKLSPDGSALVYSTYLGGNETDQATGIAIDSAGSAYVTGCNELGNFPTHNPYQSSNKANATCTGIVSKFTPDGSALVYSTYFGGTGEDMPSGIAVDSSGDAYIAGATSSTDLPTKNPLQATSKGVVGFTGFVTEFNPSGNALVYSTYLGGSNVGQVNAIAVDSKGNTYVVGETLATDFPTQNAFLATNTGDGFVSVLAPGGTSFIYSTYFPALPTALAVDSSGDAYFAGANTPAVPLPTQNPIQATSHVARNNAVGTNAFISEFNPAGSALLFSSYLGGSSSDIANAITVDASENIYVAGSALSPDFPTLNAIQPNDAGAGDGFIAKISPLILDITPSSIVLGQSAALTWSAGNAASCSASGAWGGSETISGTQAVSPAAVGTYIYTLTCIDAAGISVSTSTTLTVTANSNPPPTVTIGVNPATIMVGQSTTLTWSSTNDSACTASGAWSGSEAVSGTLSVSPGTAGTDNYTLTCTGAGGSANASATLTVSAPPPAPTVTIGVSPTSIVVGQSATLTWSSTNDSACTASGAWSGSEAVSGTQSVSPSTAGTDNYTLTCTGAGGSANASAALTVTIMAPSHPGGGGELDLLSLLGLGFLGVLRKARSGHSSDADRGAP